jgi:diacylglycerol O-acyltransferase / wax synthase
MSPSFKVKPARFSGEMVAMQQLSGMDAMFVHQETPRTPMHITPVMIYDPSTSPEKPIRYKRILQTFTHNLHKSAIFRRKLATVPWNMDNPYWMEDGKFDLEHHVRHVALPKPGDWR